MNRRISIYDVANLAKVSQSTVSRVLNNYPYVKKTTKEKVLRAIEELGYSPSEIARSLASNKTNTIGLIVEDISNSFYSETAHIILREAQRYDYEVIIIDSETSESDFKKAVNSLIGKRVDGIIVASIRRNNKEIIKLFDSGFPVLTYNRKIYKEGYENHVVLDNFLGAKLALKHLTDLDHTRIAYISGPVIYSTFYERLEGYKSFLEENSIEFDETIVFRDTLIYEDVYNFSKKLMRSSNPPTAFFASTDNMALAIMEAAVSEGLDIPGDVSVIGFDDIDIASNFYIGLTTVTQQKEKMATIVLEKLINKIEGTSISNNGVNIILKPQLIVRKTTGKLKYKGR